MLKKFEIGSLMVMFICSVLLAQELPEKQLESAQKDSLAKSEQIINPDSAKTEAQIWNKVCPVKGNPVEEDTPTVEYNGKLYGFCCPGCDSKFAKNPERYAKNLSEDGTKFIGRK